MPRKGSDFKDSEAIFSEIYLHGSWQKDLSGKGTSGAGSNLLEGFPFIVFVEKFLKTHAIQTIVDLGCGDWILSGQIDWKKRQYLGIDVVESLIKKNQEQHGSSSIRFLKLDATKNLLPKSDLLICKDVLIHLALVDIFSILAQIKRFKYCIFVNDIDPENRLQNADIKTGEFRPLNLTLFPFYLVPAYQTSYTSGNTVKHAIIMAHENYFKKSAGS